MATEAAFAPAKLNLCLHVTGRRPDGYHLLDSLVVFAGVGDQVTAEPAEGFSLVVDGPMSAGLSAGDDNLVLRAARMTGARGASLTLWKELPVASGIGGGSADAAAALRAMAALTGAPLPAPDAVRHLGADVPVCLAGRPARMRGTGDDLSPLPPLPPVWVVLANPGLPLETPAVFGAMTQRDNPPLPDRLPRWADAAALAGFLRDQRNDLEPAALRLQPAIGQVLDALGAQPGALIARMSGSGATCLALFADEGRARTAAHMMSRHHPGWWIRATTVLD